MCDVWVSGGNVWAHGMMYGPVGWCIDQWHDYE